MVQTGSFKQWLEDKTQYSAAVIGDTVSRIRRADSILEWDDKETYIFYLQKEPRYQSLSVSVRSQIKKAVLLYSDYIQSSTQKD